jgi:hypothetical protein
MIRSSGIVQQLVREPQLHLEYLDVDGRWTADRAQAFVFKAYSEADRRATELGGRPIFAMVVSAPADPVERAPIDIEPEPHSRRVFRPRRRIASAFPNLPAP